MGGSSSFNNVFYPLCTCQKFLMCIDQIKAWFEQKEIQKLFSTFSDQKRWVAYPSPGIDSWFQRGVSWNLASVLKIKL